MRFVNVKSIKETKQQKNQAMVYSMSCREREMDLDQTLCFNPTECPTIQFSHQLSSIAKTLLAQGMTLHKNATHFRSFLNF